MVGGAEVQGVESAWDDMVSSMLASPQGASEQYMWMVTSGGRVKGWNPLFCASRLPFSRGVECLIQGEDGYGGVEMRRHWSRRKRLKVRIVRISACQSCRTLP